MANFCELDVFRKKMPSVTSDIGVGVLSYGDEDALQCVMISRLKMH